MTLNDAVAYLQANFSNFQMQTKDTEEPQYYVASDFTSPDKTDADQLKDAMNVLFDAVNTGTLHQ